MLGFLALSGFLVCSIGADPEPATVNEVVHVFNGKDLSNFYTYIKDRGRDQDPKKVFSVSDGLLRISGEEWGCLTTERAFENYRLVAEFKWGDRTFAPRTANARDNGILVHSTGADGAFGKTWMYSIECQLIEGGTGDILVVGDGSDRFSATTTAAPEKQAKCNVYQPGGAPATIHEGRINWFGRDPDWKDVVGFRGKQDAEKPLGEWNRLECVADGSTLTIILNGVIVNRGFDVRPSAGRIQIQSEGAEVFFRRFDLLPLTPAPTAPVSPKRFIYNSDADNMFIYRDYPMKAEDVFGYVDELTRGEVTTLFMSPNVGMNVNYPGGVSDMLGTHLSPELAKGLANPPATPAVSLERAAVNYQALVDSGHDPLRLVLDRAREKGLETFISFRLNEVHQVEQADGMLLSRFWKEHPEWHIGKVGDPLPPVYQEILGPNTSPIVGTWLPGGLDFAVSEVRRQRLAEIRECCERYAVDGLDLDFQRFPMYFKPGHEGENIATMTAWVKEVRDMTNRIGRERGRPILLSARVMARPEQNRAIGLDPVAWAQGGLVDFLTVSHYLRNDFPLPVDAYKKLLPETMPVYASIEVAPDATTYRRIARQLWRSGADGLMLFNFFTTREGGKEPPFSLLNELGRPATIPKDDSMLLVLNKHEDTMSFVDSGTLKPVAKIPTGPNPHELVLSKDRRFAYLSNYAPPGNTISVIDLVERRLVQQIDTGQYTRIHGAAIARDGKHAYFTAGQSGYVVEVDTQTNAVVRAIPTGGKISHMVLVSPDGKKLFTANIDTRNVSVIDRATGQLVTQIACDRGCEGMAFTPDGRSLWAANQEAGSISIIDLATYTVRETMPCPGMPVRIRFTPDGLRVLVSSWTANGELVVIDARTLREIKRIPVGSQAIGLEVDPDGRRAYVGCEHTDGVHVVDLDSLTVVGKIQTGDGSDAVAWWSPPEK